MKRLLSLGLMAMFSLLGCFGASYAQEETGASGWNSVITRRISMGVGKFTIVDLPQEAAEVFVANPKVANALVRSPRKLYLIDVDAGQTSVFVLDHEGRKIAAFELSIGRDIGELQQILRAAMPSSSIVARTVNDTIILTGTVDSPEEAQRAYNIAKGFVASPWRWPARRSSVRRRRRGHQFAHHSWP